jgi:hypothetical protein
MSKRLSEEQFSALLMDALQVLKVGKGDRRGLGDAVALLKTNLPTQLLPDTYEEVDLLADYLNREARGTATGMLTGISYIDDLTDGQEEGALWVIAAYTGEGKSQMLQNIAYHRRLAGLNGLFFSTEQTIIQIKRRLVVRHAMHPKFGASHGVLYSDVRRGRLTGNDRELYLGRVLPDWESMPAQLEIRPAPARSSLSELFDRAEEFNSQQKLDYIVIDYLSQLAQGTGSGRGNDWEILAALVVEAKQLALNFDGGRGIPLLTAAQTNASSYVQALKDGKYFIRTAAGSSEFEKSADFFMTMLRMPDEPGVIKCGVLKNRDDESDKQFELVEDYAHCRLGDRDRADRDDDTWRVNI